MDLLLTKGFASGEVKSWLSATGIGAAWNEALDRGRPRSIAPRVLPLFTGRVADVLSGSGTLTAELATAVQIDAYERPSAYPEVPAIVTRPLDDLWSVPAGSYQTILFSTVLHHEPDPESLVERVLRTQCPERLVVIENCVDEGVSKDFHDFMDAFFNISLNDFAVDCPGEHRTVQGWLDFLGRYGSASFAGRLDAVTGMPFPYEIFVVDVDREACR
ncbi:hypothetical protein V6U77_18635 [Micromonospora sp. CPCC 205546]